MRTVSGWRVEPIALQDDPAKFRVTYLGLLMGGSRAGTKWQGLMSSIEDVQATMGPAFADLQEG